MSSETEPPELPLQPPPFSEEASSTPASDYAVNEKKRGDVVETSSSDSGGEEGGSSPISDDSSNTEQKTVDALHRVCDMALSEEVPLFTHLPENKRQALLTVLANNRQHAKETGVWSRLELEREQLRLQVSVLGDQVEVQAEKIRELEGSLDDAKINYSLKTPTELSESPHKLDLLAEASALRMRLQTSEQNSRESDDKLQRAQTQLTDLTLKLRERDLELSKARSLTNGVSGVGLGGSLPSSGESEERLRRAVDTLLTANIDKDKQIEELQSAVRKYRRLLDLAVEDSCMSENSSRGHLSASVKSLNVRTMPDRRERMNSSGRDVYHTEQAAVDRHHSLDYNHRLDPASPVAGLRMFLLKRLKSPHLSGGSPPSSEQGRRPLLRSSLSFRYDLSRHTGEQLSRADAMAQEYRRRVEDQQRSMLYPAEQPQDKKKPVWQRFLPKRTKNGSEPFQRGAGARSTTGPRINPLRHSDMSSTTQPPSPGRINSPVTPTAFTFQPFSRWEPERVVEWFNELGLGQYTEDVRRWRCSGEKLLHATQHDLEKELGMKAALHRKKLLLAVQSMEQNNPAAALGNLAVMRWLDDVGLPQYKDKMFDSRMDGLLLNSLTLDDLMQLKITNQIHALSLKSGVLLLRHVEFDISQLERRPADGETEEGGGNVLLWTNHRVMEWLRSIDLSEYAANLRGSGVHGALLVLEPSFTCETLASLLLIPQNKSLLRRHLHTHFGSLLGPAVLKHKRSSHSPLLPAAKIKVPKRGLFAGRGQPGEEANLLCQVGETIPQQLLDTSAD